MDAPIQAAPEGEEAPPKSGPKGIVLVGALVGALLIGAAAGLFALGPVIASKSGYVVAIGDSTGAHPDSAAGEDGEPAATGEGAVSNLHLIDNLVLNPAGSGGSRFLMLTASIEFQDPTMIDEIKVRDAEARDIVLRVMGAKSVEELSDLTNRELLKRQLADSLGTMFKKKQVIRRIFFPQFVIQ